MTDKHPSAPVPAKTRQSHSGVIHVNEPHTENFTVVGNHLAQHSELSLLAIGLAVHIQSLPAGASAGIKALAGRFPEGEIRIAAALRELEEHGYLTRARERLHSGRVITRTTSYNRPRNATTPAAEPAVPVPAPPKASAPGRTPAVDLLTRLRTYDSRLLLSERDVQRLVPDVSAWFERGVGPTAVERALTSGLPQDPIRHPAAFLARRLRELLPPSLPVPPPPAARVRPARLQDCDGCDRPFRSPEPGQCRDCRMAGAA
ncbi:helix-turn-helix domain-containing protein [Streptomyces sp. S3(2020)]|uniref:helix-turn-helix domain-containing protein n=1 Tax=Streptomyces sp. S3(2020) TaxID=2732044 RepID=UPI0014877C0A|nr:helix-turn-helix domain-containing protein [Streptomyces sp. S3(2020)]NNN36417.1 helix-turn-helix domain-containing protein [Streptomyces sp. S3(2020)]